MMMTVLAIAILTMFAVVFGLMAVVPLVVAAPGRRASHVRVTRMHRRHRPVCSIERPAA